MAYVPFGVRFMAHCMHSVYRQSDVDRKGKLFFPFLYAVFMLILIRKLSILLFVRCVYSAMFAFDNIPKHAQLSSRSGLDNMGPKGPNLFSNYFN